jgi:hypothetical protein
MKYEPAMGRFIPHRAFLRPVGPRRAAASPAPRRQAGERFTIRGNRRACQHKSPSPDGTCSFHFLADIFFGNKFTSSASYSCIARHWARAVEAARFPPYDGKDETPMKKLLALLIVGGLLGATTGCPPTTTKSTTGGTKTSTTTTTGTSTKDKKPEDKKPEDKKPEDKKPEDKKPTDKKPEDKKPEDKKPEDKKPTDKKPTDK